MLEKKVAENMKDDDELDILLSEIPHATSSLDTHHQQNNRVDHCYGHPSCVFQKMNGYGESHVHGMSNDVLLKHKYACVSSPVSGVSLQSDGSSSSLLPGGVRSPYYLPPQFQEIKTHSIYGNRFPPDFNNENVNNTFDDFILPKHFSKMYISEEQECVQKFTNGVQSCNRSPNAAIWMNLQKYGASDNYRKGFSGYEGFNLSVPRGPINIEWEEARSPLVEMLHDQSFANLSRSRYSLSRFERLFSQSDFDYSPLSPQFYGTNVFADRIVGQDAHCGDTFLYASRNGMNLIESRDAFYSPNVVQLTRLMPHYSEEDVLHYQPSMANGRNILPRHTDFFTRKDSLITHGESINHETGRGNAHLRGHNTNGLLRENGGVRPQEKRSQVECWRSRRMAFPLPLSSKFRSLIEARGYIHHLAKDQSGCRFLQMIFDEGTSQEVSIIFHELIDHVVELMLNPFGNYLMQKLLEVCDEQQRMHILLRVTEEPRGLIRISLNTHGSRVVQKLIETLKTRQQISLVIAALEPGFLALIKDLNGNHVVRRCLECFTLEDSKFIFVAAMKYCVEIATHQHGCCVLQRCISHSSGVLRKNLVSEISANGILLAQDAYGNYVIQFILELKIPSAMSKLTRQFEGNFVNLSRQKFSSHVVEKCLLVCKDEVKSTIIHELLSASSFDQLLQDPHANYVVQAILRVSEGPLHQSFVNAIESHRAISRNNPYSKRIFSNKLLKR